MLKKINSSNKSKIVHQLKSRIKTPREAAIKVYAKWQEKPSRIEPLAGRELERSDWDGRERALFFELLYGAVRWHGHLKWLIDELSRRGVSCGNIGYSSAVIGLYQILKLDHVQIYAVVDSAVEVARRAEGPQVAGWVNALLRRVGRERDLWMNAEPHTRDSVYNSAIKSSHPVWLVKRWAGRFKPEQLERFLTWNNRRPRISIRINSHRIQPDEALRILEQEGVDAKCSTFDHHFIILRQTGDPSNISLISKGLAVVQDISQGLVSRIVKPLPGERVLDLCSAPGGKTGHIADLCPDCQITATDKSDERLAFVTELKSRLDYSNISIIPYQELLTSRAHFDAVLIDAPCMGTGVLARRPDLRWRLRPDDIQRMASIQLQLLRYAAERVRKGGRIIYSTCSVEPEENEGVVNNFLMERREFREEPVKEFLPVDIPDDDGRLNLLGPEIDGDGVFTARLVRIK